MKKIKIGKLEVRVCEHKGDISYARYVMFKQYAPQFWEKMDSPLFESYYERIMDHFNKGEWMQGFMRLKDYKVAIDNTKYSYDAWGVCFALITGLKGEDIKSPMNDADIGEKIEKLKAEGLDAETVKKSVLDFMSASPETFQDHLLHYASQRMTGEMISSEEL